MSMWESICPFSVALASPVKMSREQNSKRTGPDQVQVLSEDVNLGGGSSEAMKDQDTAPPGEPSELPSEGGCDHSYGAELHLVPDVSSAVDQIVDVGRAREFVSCIVNEAVNCEEIRGSPALSTKLQSKRSYESEGTCKDETSCSSETDTAYETPRCPSEAGNYTDSSSFADELDQYGDSDSQDDVNTEDGHSAPTENNTFSIYANAFAKVFITLLPSVIVIATFVELFAYAWSKF